MPSEVIMQNCRLHLQLPRLNSSQHQLCSLSLTLSMKGTQMCGKAIQTSDFQPLLNFNYWTFLTLVALKPQPREDWCTGGSYCWWIQLFIHIMRRGRVISSIRSKSVLAWEKLFSSYFHTVWFSKSSCWFSLSSEIIPKYFRLTKISTPLETLLLSTVKAGVQFFTITTVTVVVVIGWQQ